MRMALTVAAAFGMLAAAPLPAALAADDMTIALSAQQNQQQKRTAKPATAKPATAKPAARTHTNRNANVNRNTNVNRTVHTNRNNTTRTKNVTTTTTKRNANVTTTRSRNVTTTRNAAPPRQVTFNTNRQTFAGTKARAWHRNGNWNYRGRNYSYWRGGPYRYRYNNTWRTYVALSALTAIAVGTATYYPYAYVSAPQEVCEGITEDGCQLTWSEVETVEGGVAPVCVTYCPWQ